MLLRASVSRSDPDEIFAASDHAADADASRVKRALHFTL
jgi:hypothetical protein